MNLRQSVLATLAYHDIFDYPLNTEEITQFQIESKSETTHIEKILKTLLKLNLIGEEEGYSFLKGRKKIIESRGKRVKYTKNKLKKALFYKSLLKKIPSVQMVAITGALAMNNSTSDDDIDLLIISFKNTLWTTRLLSNLILFPYKRKPESKKQKNKACLNIFIDESDLKIKQQNLYTAHELAQLKPIFDRDGTYSKFIKSNRWLYKYLPNWKPLSVQAATKRTLNINDFTLVVKLFEALAKYIQLTYMKSKITTEKIEKAQLFFHPSQVQDTILTKYKKKIKNLSGKIS